MGPFVFTGATMSADTKAALEAALEAHIADECEGDLTGAYVVVAETTSLADLDTGDGAFFYETRNTQSTFTGRGLLHAALERGAYISVPPDEDD